jgi:FtsP/CotA-like multicopper oxidase with cupredoxin domain
LLFAVIFPKMRGLSTSFLVLVTTALVHAREIPYELDLENDRVNPDGFPRSAITLNGITPGPILTGFKGDDLLVTVNNELTDHSMRVSSTIHWHGIVSRSVVCPEALFSLAPVVD